VAGSAQLGLELAVGLWLEASSRGPAPLLHLYLNLDLDLSLSLISTSNSVLQSATATCEPGRPAVSANPQSPISNLKWVGWNLAPAAR